MVNAAFINISVTLLRNYQQENKTRMQHSHKYRHHCARHHITKLHNKNRLKPQAGKAV